MGFFSFFLFVVLEMGLKAYAHAEQVLYPELYPQPTVKISFFYSAVFECVSGRKTKGVAKDPLTTLVWTGGSRCYAIRQWENKAPTPQAFQT
jgi:hypothetical protein